SITINVIADVIRADEALKKKFFNGELKWEEVKKEIDSSKLESSKKAFLSAFQNTGNTSTLLNKLLKDNPQHEQVISEDNALQYLDVLITVNSLTGGKCGDVVKAYLEGLNQDSANQFALVSIASVASNSDDTWLWYTIPSWYAQFTSTSVEIPLTMTGNSINDFFDKYEATVSGTSFSGNAASLKSHRAWAWWHKQISGYTAPQLSQWATTYRPTDRNGQMTGNTGYTFYGGNGKSVYTPPPVYAHLVGNVSIYVTSPENPETVAEKGDTSTAVVEVSLSSAEKLQEMKDNLKIVGATGGSAEIEVVIKGSKLQGSGANDNFLDEELSKHPLTEINGCTFEKTEEDGKNVWTWKFTLKGLTDPNWYDKTAKTGLIYYMKEKSPYKIKFTDTDVTVDDATENKYEVYVKWTVKDKNGVEQSSGYFTPKGQEKDEKQTYNDTINNNKKAKYISYDTANWQPGDPITPPPPSGEPD
ncbi:MAG: hypothetical protein K2I47_04995, partial [Odoribacter sp.]|nr:hypothetical protein [Odoribacter sp.]